MAGTLVLFPDTNLFFQCRALQSLDWSNYAEFEEIKLYLTRPVQSEIDEHKSKGSGRLSKRARAASTIIRDLLKPGVESHVVKDLPLVSLFLRQDLKKDDSLSDQLDYQLRDDQLVGIAAAYAKAHPDEAVRILTHDTGPMATARLVGLAFEEIPEDWILPPETDEVDKNLNKLKSELARYQNAEPKISLKISGGGWNADKKQIALTITRYVPLTTEQVDLLITEIKTQSPIAHDFDLTEVPDAPAPNLSPLLGLSLQVFKPASAEAIEEYTTRSYPDWLTKCEEKLRTLHAELEVVWPTIKVELANDGARPASDVLIGFEAKGNFLISTQLDTEDRAPKPPPRLPNAPRPPAGTWTKPLSIGSAIAQLDFKVGSASSAPYLDLHNILPRHLRLPARDPNKFYYKVAERGVPCRNIQLECEQWRHQTGAEDTELLVLTAGQAGVVKGSLHVQVHGSNMTEPFLSITSMTIVTEEHSVFQLAKKLIASIKIGTKFKLGTE